MAIPITGWQGKVTQGTADTALVFIQSFDGEITQDITEQGPFLNDGGTIYGARGALKLKGTMKGVTPSGKDTSQTAILSAVMAGNDIKTTLVSLGGYSIVCTASMFENIKLGQDAKGTATFEASFRNNGTFTAG